MSYSGFTENEVEAAKEAKDQLSRLIRQRQEKLKLLRGELKPSDYDTQRKPVYHIPPESRAFPHYTAGHDPKNYDQLMRERRDQFAKKQDENAMRLREFNMTRAYLLDERKRLLALREKVVDRPISPLYNDGGHEDYITDAWEHIRVRPDRATARMGWDSPEGKPVDDIVTDIKSKLPRIEKKCAINQKANEKRMKMMHEAYDGSLGLKSYEPWQITHYHICRRIVEDEMTRLLEKLLPVDGTDHVAERKRLDILMKDKLQEKAVQLLNEELIFEVTMEESEATAEEYFYLKKLSLNMADQACILETEVRAIRQPRGRPSDDPTHQLVTDNFYKAQRQRDEQNPNVWAHSQNLVIKNPTAAERREQEEDTDTVNLAYSDLPPAQLKRIEPLDRDETNERHAWQIRKQYWSNELLYWNKLEISHTTLTIPNNASVITAIAISLNGNMIAIGTKNSTILLYQAVSTDAKSFILHLVSPLPPKTKNQSNLLDPIVNISWSIDCVRFVSITLNGVLTVWSVNKWTAGTSQTVDTSFKIAPLKVLPGALIHEFRMSRALNDFLFRSGPLGQNSDAGDKIWSPQFAQFLPAFSLVGSAPVICVGMSNNDFLRIDAEHGLQSRTGKTARSTENQTENDFVKKRELFKLNYSKVEGKDVPPHKLIKLKTGVDLFRGHKHPIIFMRLINNMDELVTVDDQAYLMIWRYHSKYLSRGNNYWFDPIRRCRISMKLEMFEMNDEEEPCTHYDSVSPDSTNNTRTDLRRAETEIAEADFRHPVYQVVNVKNNFSTLVYRNTGERATESGAILHEVSRQLTTNELLLYITRIYRRYYHFADAFLGCCANSTCTLLTALILYPSDPPERDPWIEVVTIDIKNLTTCEPRIQITLLFDEYQGIIEQGTIFFSIMPSMKPIGAEYLVINMLGKARIFSLLTGQEVFRAIAKARLPTTKRTFFGQEMLESKMCLKKESEIFTSFVERKPVLFTYILGSNFLSVVSIKDKNSLEMSQTMADLANYMNAIPENQRDFPPPSKQMFTRPFYLALPDHPEAIVRNWLYEAMENAVERVDGPVPLSVSKRFQLDDRKRAYDAVILPEVKPYLEDEKGLVEIAPEQRAAEQKHPDEEDDELVNENSKNYKMPDFMD